VKASLTNDPKVPTSSSATASATTSAATSATSHIASSTTGSSSTSGGSAAANTSIYANSVVAPFSDWSWAATRNAADTSKFHSSPASYSFVPYDYQGVYFESPATIDTTKHKSIEFWINGGTSGGQNINVDLLRTSSGTITGPDLPVSSYLGGAAIPSGSTWKLGTINLATFPAGTYDGIWFQDKSGGTQGTVYIDDVKAVGK